MSTINNKGRVIVEHDEEEVAKQNPLPTEPISDYAVEVDDYTTSNVTYVGKAIIGSLTSNAVWQVKKIDETTGVVLTWADGNSNFDNIWDNRVSLSYS